MESELKWFSKFKDESMRHPSDEFEPVWDFLESLFIDVDHHKIGSFSNYNQLR